MSLCPTCKLKYFGTRCPRHWQCPHCPLAIPLIDDDKITCHKFFCTGIKHHYFDDVVIQQRDTSVNVMQRNPTPYHPIDEWSDDVNTLPDDTFWDGDANFDMEQESQYAKGHTIFPETLQNKDSVPVRNEGNNEGVVVRDLPEDLTRLLQGNNNLLGQIDNFTSELVQGQTQIVDCLTSPSTGLPELTDLAKQQRSTLRVIEQTNAALLKTVETISLTLNEFVKVMADPEVGIPAIAHALQNTDGQPILPDIKSLTSNIASYTSAISDSLYDKTKNPPVSRIKNIEEKLGDISTQLEEGLFDNNNNTQPWLGQLGVISGHLESGLFVKDSLPLRPFLQDVDDNTKNGLFDSEGPYLEQFKFQGELLRVTLAAPTDPDKDVLDEINKAIRLGLLYNTEKNAYLDKFQFEKNGLLEVTVAPASDPDKDVLKQIADNTSTTATNTGDLSIIEANTAGTHSNTQNMSAVITKMHFDGEQLKVTYDDENGNLSKIATNTKDTVTSLERFNFDGAQLKVTYDDENGNLSKIATNTKDTVTSLERFNFDGAQLKVTYDDENGNLSKIATNTKDTVTSLERFNFDGAQLKVTYDDEDGNMKKIVDNTQKTADNTTNITKLSFVQDDMLGLDQRLSVTTANNGDQEDPLDDIKKGTDKLKSPNDDDDNPNGGIPGINASLTGSIDGAFSGALGGFGAIGGIAGLLSGGLFGKKTTPTLSDLEIGLMSRSGTLGTDINLVSTAVNASDHKFHVTVDGMPTVKVETDPNVDLNVTVTNSSSDPLHVTVDNAADIKVTVDSSLDKPLFVTTTPEFPFDVTIDNASDIKVTLDSSSDKPIYVTPSSQPFDVVVSNTAEEGVYVKTADDSPLRTRATIVDDVNIALHTHYGALSTNSAIVNLNYDSVANPETLKVQNGDIHVALDDPNGNTLYHTDSKGKYYVPTGTADGTSGNVSNRVTLVDGNNKELGVDANSNLKVAQYTPNNQPLNQLIGNFYNTPVVNATGANFNVHIVDSAGYDIVTSYLDGNNKYSYLPVGPFSADVNKTKDRPFANVLVDDYLRFAGQHATDENSTTFYNIQSVDAQGRTLNNNGYNSVQLYTQNNESVLYSGRAMHTVNCDDSGEFLHTQPVQWYVNGDSCTYGKTADGKVVPYVASIDVEPPSGEGPITPINTKTTLQASRERSISTTIPTTPEEVQAFQEESLKRTQSQSALYSPETTEHFKKKKIWDALRKKKTPMVNHVGETDSHKAPPKEHKTGTDPHIITTDMPTDSLASAADDVEKKLHITTFDEATDVSTDNKKIHTYPPAMDFEDTLDFVGRRICIGATDVNSTIAPGQVLACFDPVAAAISDSIIWNKLSGFKYMRLKVKVDVTVNATAFDYGVGFITVVPVNRKLTQGNAPKHTLNQYASFPNTAYFEYKQEEHVSVETPYLYPNQFIEIGRYSQASYYRPQMFQCIIGALTPLLTGSDCAPVTLTFWTTITECHLDTYTQITTTKPDLPDWKLVTPVLTFLTEMLFDNIKGNDWGTLATGGLFNNGVNLHSGKPSTSKGKNGTERKLGTFTRKPIAANGKSKSAPKQVQKDKTSVTKTPNVKVQNAFTDLAHGSGKDTVKSIALNPTPMVDDIPDITCSAKDEMDFNYIASSPYLTSIVNLASTSDPGTIIYHFLVAPTNVPCREISNDTTNGKFYKNYQIAQTYAGKVANAARWQRMPMKIYIKPVCSAVHGMKLRVCYRPGEYSIADMAAGRGITLGSEAHVTSYVFSLGETVGKPPLVFEIDWQKDKLYCETDCSQWATSSFLNKPTADIICPITNGIFYIQVLNRLTYNARPGGEVPDVKLLIWTSAGENANVARATSSCMSVNAHYPANQKITIISNTLPPEKQTTPDDDTTLLNAVKQTIRTRTRRAEPLVNQGWTWEEMKSTESNLFGHNKTWEIPHTLVMGECFDNVKQQLNRLQITKRLVNQSLNTAIVTATASIYDIPPFGRNVMQADRQNWARGTDDKTFQFIDMPTYLRANAHAYWQDLYAVQRGGFTVKVLGMRDDRSTDENNAVVINQATYRPLPQQKVSFNDPNAMAGALPKTTSAEGKISVGASYKPLDTPTIVAEAFIPYCTRELFLWTPTPTLTRTTAVDPEFEWTTYEQDFSEKPYAMIQTSLPKDGNLQVGIEAGPDYVLSHMVAPSSTSFVVCAGVIPDTFV